jgi:hypothetical protein
MRELCTTPLFVIPAKAVIQEVLDNTGFRVALRLHGMTKLLVLCSYAKLSVHSSRLMVILENTSYFTCQYPSRSLPIRSTRSLDLSPDRCSLIVLTLLPSLSASSSRVIFGFNFNSL